MQPNPHPLGYHELLSRIVLEHPDGGVDLHAEVARRFLADSGVAGMPAPPATLPIVQQNTIPEQPPQDSAGTPQINGVTGANDQPFVDYGSDEDINQRLDKVSAQEGLKPGTPATTGLPSVPKAQPSAAAKPVSRGTGGSRQAAPADETDQGIREGTNAKIQSEEDVADVAKQHGAQDAQEQGAIAAQQQALQDRDQKIQDYTQENQKRLLQKQEMLVDKYANASVDPKRYWNSLDTGHKILAGISLMLSGNGDGSPVMRAIEGDVQAQKDALERTKNSAGMVKDLFEEYSKMGLDSRQATQMAVNTATTIGVQRAKTTAAQFVGPAAGALVGGKIGDALIAQSKDIQGNHKTTADIALARAQAAEAGERAVGQRQQNTIQGANIDWMRKNGMLGVPVGNQVVDADGNRGFAPDSGTAEAYNKETMPAQQLMATLNEIKQKRAQGVVGNLGDLQALRGRLEQNLAGMGEMKESKRNQEILERMSGDPTQLYHMLPGSSWEKHLQGLEELAKTSIDTSKKVHPGIRFIQAPQVPEQKRY